jgi:hypothetical protein
VKVPRVEEVAVKFSARYVFSSYAYNPACACEYCVNGGDNPTPAQQEARTMMVQQGGSFCYGEPHMPPSAREDQQR